MRLRCAGLRPPMQPVAASGTPGLQCRVAVLGCSAGGAASSCRCGSAATAHCTVGSWKVAGPWARPGEAYRSEGGGHRVVERLGEAQVRHVHMRRAVEHACRGTAAGCNPVLGCRLQPCVGLQAATLCRATASATHTMTAWAHTTAARALRTDRAASRPQVCTLSAPGKLVSST